MKKYLLFIVVFFISCSFCFSQQVSRKYLEVSARFDAVGNIVMETLPESIKHGADTTLNNKKINQLINKGGRSLKVINLLATEGWQLLFVLQTDKQGGRNALAPDLLYYFKRE
ncbi:MAG: hypothetical protein NTW29_09830 [Bacteroidetes bacterium]|nr:hypothetical protein [Bacteroidota bacterium]